MEIAYIQKSSHRQMLSSKRHVTIPAPVYIEKKDMSQDLLSQGQMTSKKFQLKSKPVRGLAISGSHQPAKPLNPITLTKTSTPFPSPSSPQPLSLTLTNTLIWLMYCICSSRVNSKHTIEYGWIEVIEVITGLFVVLLLIRGCYTNCEIKPWMALHMVSIVLTLGFYLSLEEPLHTVIGAFRPVRLLLIFCVQGRLAQTLQRIFKAMIGLWKGALGILLICFLYSLAAMQLFMGDIEYKCRPTPYPVGDWPALSPMICGSRPCAANTFCASPLQFNLPPQPLQSLTEQLTYGFSNFNNLFDSFLTMFQLIRTINWSGTTFMHSDYFNRELTFLFFASFIIVGPLVLMNLLLALLYEDFEKAPAKTVQKRRQLEATQIGVSKVLRTMNPSEKIIEEEEEQPRVVESVEMVEEEKTSAGGAGAGVGVMTVSKYAAGAGGGSPKVVLHQVSKYCNFSFLSKCFFHLVILTQVSIVCLDRYSLNPLQNRNLGLAYGICVIFNLVQLTLLLHNYYSTGIASHDKVTLIIDGLDLAVVLINVVDYIWKIVLGMYIYEQSTGLTGYAMSLICIRLFKLFDGNVFDEKLSHLLRAFFEAILDLLPFLAVIITLVIFGSAVSLQLFNNKLRVAGIYILPSNQSYPLIPSLPPLINFDTFLNSLVAFTSIIQNQQWHLTMYKLILSGHPWTVAYFIIVVIFGEFILMRLFLVTYINSYLQKVKQYRIISEPKVDDRRAEERLEIAMRENSMWVIKTEWKVRQAAMILITHEYYRRLCAMLLVVYVVLLVFSNTIEGALPFCYALDAFFAVDMIINIVVYKFYGEYSYSSSGLNILQLVINVLVLASSFTNEMTRIIRAIRALRIMRAIKYFRSLQILMVSIIQSVRLILRLVLFLLTFLLLIGCIALKQLKGSTSSCSLPEFSNKLSCMDNGGDWLNRLGVGFDTIFESMFNIFAVITSQGWLSIMTVVMGVKGVDQAVDVTKPNQSWGLFFIPVFFVGNYLFINIFVGVLIEKAQTVSKAYDAFESSIKGLPEENQEWARIKNYIFKLKPSQSMPRPSGLKSFLFTSLQSPTYSNFTKLCTLLNCLVFALFYSGQSLSMHNTLAILNQIFFLVFVSQYLIEVYMYGSQRKSLYLDLICIITSIPGVYLQYVPIWRTNTGEFQTFKEIVHFLKALQVLRLYRLLTCFRPVREYFNGIIKILPNVSSLFGMFFMILFVSAILAQDLFGKVKLNNSITTRGINFTNFFNSMFSLFKIVTGELWFAHAIDATRPMELGYLCGRGGEGECGRREGLGFFVMFLLTMGVIFLNLLVATILTMSVKSLNLEERATSRYKLGNFIKLWNRYDEGGEGYINYKVFFQFSMAMAMECGIDKKQFHEVRRKKMFMRILNIPVYEHQRTRQYCYLFHDVAICMSKASLLLKQSSRFEFVLHQPSITSESLMKTKNPGDFVLTDLNSGNLATVLLMLGKLRRWRKQSCREGNSGNSGNFTSNLNLNSNVGSVNGCSDRTADYMKNK